MQFNTGEDVIMFLGSKILREAGEGIHPPFSLANPKLRRMYEKAFYNFAGNAPTYPFALPARANPCAELGINSKMGMAIVGTTGIGKSLLFRVFARYFFGTQRELVVLHAKELPAIIADEALGLNYVLDMYGKKLLQDLYIDDLGHEQAIVYVYGNPINVIEELMTQRAELYANRGIKTHFTSNLAMAYRDDDITNANTDSLKKKYGKRFVSRCNEMCQIMTWQDDDLRVKKQLEVTNGNNHL